MTADRFPPDRDGRRWAMIEITGGPDWDGWYDTTRGWVIHDDTLHDLPPSVPGWAAYGGAWCGAWGYAIIEHGLDWRTRNGHHVVHAGDKAKPLLGLMYLAREPLEPPIRPGVAAVIVLDDLTQAETEALAERFDRRPSEADDRIDADEVDAMLSTLRDRSDPWEAPNGRSDV